ncbi:MAG: DUF1566 domain-containing protein [Vitreoscilla sp.]|jgi:hypothetical protein|nr:DUF1566 domain-containing protein [Vitreoscilla sp.]
MTVYFRAVFAATCAAAAIAMPATAGTGRITLNDTGMTQCIDHHKDWSSDCTKSRQDAADGRDADVNIPDDGAAGFSFQKVCRSGQMAGDGSCPVDPPLGSGPDDWGCVYDNVTQLTWEAKTDDSGMHDYQRFYTNKGEKARGDSSDVAWLVDATNAETLCGATNWRLPGVLELQSIVAYGNGAPGMPYPWIDPTFFIYTLGGHAWTSVEDVHEHRFVWYVHFGNGRVSSDARFKPYGVRLVHNLTAQGQASLGKARFIPSPDGTEVTDIMTGLAWRRCAEGMAWNNDAQTCDGLATLFDWQDALDHARANHEGGWRIPNIKELLSLANHKKRHQTLDELAFPNSPLSFLSSTAVDSNGDVFVKYVGFTKGSVEERAAYNNNAPLPLRFVRRGRE